MFGRRFKEFKVGDEFMHFPGKTITECDNNLFSLLTMNHHPVHLDKNFAQKAHHGQVLVVGTLVFSLVVGQSVRDISGLAIANLSYDKVTHLGPTFVGDTIYSKSKILGVRRSQKNSSRGIVTVYTEAWNQSECPVLSFERKILVPD